LLHFGFCDASVFESKLMTMTRRAFVDLVLLCPPISVHAR